MSRIQWEKAIPIFKNRFILKGVLLAIGIPLAGILILIIVLSKGDVFGTDARYFFGLILMFSILAALLVFSLYYGKYAPGFIVDEEGIVNFSQQKQAKTSKTFNMLLIVFGLFRSTYAPISAGYSAICRPVMKIEWKDMKKVRYFPKQYTILVQGGFTEKLVVFCTKGNYEAVVEIIKEKMEQYSKI